MANTINWNSPYVKSCFHEQAECYGDGEYCVYFWQDWIGDVFYVGSGKGYRFNDVNEKSRSREFLAQYRCGGCSPKIVAYGMGKEESIAFEKRLIKSFWKLEFPLTNKNGIREHEKEYIAVANEKRRLSRLKRLGAA